MNALAVKMLMAIKDEEFTARELRDAGNDLRYHASSLCTANINKIEAFIKENVERLEAREDR